MLNYYPKNEINQVVLKIYVEESCNLTLEFYSHNSKKIFSDIKKTISIFKFKREI